MVDADKLFKMNQLLRTSKYPVPRSTFERELGCHRSTIKRLINQLKSLHAPIQYDRQYNGYYYDQEESSNFELPGLWFNASELQALLTVQHLLKEMQPGLLEPHIAPFKSRIKALLNSTYTGNKNITSKVRIISMNKRINNQEIFQQIADVVINSKQVEIIYHSRSKNKKTVRLVSPQRLIHYRDNWYCDAWDHKKSALRSFAIERIKKIIKQKQRAKKIQEKILDQHYTSAYGIFAGKPKHTAVLKFDSNASRWVAEETWHPEQVCEKQKDGSCILQIPYSDAREILMDILKYGSRVEVLEPKELRKEVKQALTQAIKKY